MRHETIDLYHHFHIQPPAGAVAQLQMWLPDPLQVSGMSRLRPAILILPGGGYEHVSFRESEPVALRFVVKGYATFVLRYSCAPHRFPVALREAAMAMRYVRENAESFFVDGNMVAALGFSAGGHLCGCLGTMYDCPELSDIADSSKIRPDVLGLCYPVAVSWGRTHEGSFRNLCGDDQVLWQRLSMEKLVRPDMPPAFIWHTRTDATVPCRNSLLLASAMEQAGVDFALHIYRKGQHGLSTADEMAYPADAVPDISWDVPGWLEAATRFFEECGFAVRDLPHP